MDIECGWMTMWVQYLYIKWEVIQFQIFHEGSFDDSLLSNEGLSLVIVQQPVPNLLLGVSQRVFYVQFGIPEFIEFYGFRLY